LVDYGDRLGNRTVFKRLGYLLETLNVADVVHIAASRERLSAGIALLDPDGAPRGRRVPRWGLMVNATVGPEEPA
jgi:predicted transcriptional regulator of viral defense system